MENAKKQAGVFSLSPCIAPSVWWRVRGVQGGLPPCLSREISKLCVCAFRFNKLNTDSLFTFHFSLMKRAEVRFRTGAKGRENYLTLLFETVHPQCVHQLQSNYPTQPTATCTNGRTHVQDDTLFFCQWWALLRPLLIFFRFLALTGCSFAWTCWSDLLLRWYVMFMSSFSYISPFSPFSSAACLTSLGGVIIPRHSFLISWYFEMGTKNVCHSSSCSLFLLSVSHTRLFLTSFMYVDLA